MNGNGDGGTNEVKLWLKFDEEAVDRLAHALCDETMKTEWGVPIGRDTWEQNVRPEVKESYRRLAERALTTLVEIRQEREGRRSDDDVEDDDATAVEESSM